MGVALSSPAAHLPEAASIPGPLLPRMSPPPTTLLGCCFVDITNPTSCHASRTTGGLKSLESSEEHSTLLHRGSLMASSPFIKCHHSARGSTWGPHPQHLEGLSARLETTLLTGPLLNSPLKSIRTIPTQTNSKHFHSAPQWVT